MSPDNDPLGNMLGEVLNQFEAIETLRNAGPDSRFILILETPVKEDPGMVDGWYHRSANATSGDVWWLISKAHAHYSKHFFGGGCHE